MNTISIFAVAVYLFSQGTPSPEQSLFACKHSDQLGVYDQCEPIQVLEVLKDSTRAYSLASKQVSVYPNKQIFETQSVKKNERLQQGESFLVSGAALSNASDQHHRSICQIQVSSKSDFHRLNCGSSQNKMLHFKKIHRMKAWKSSDPISQSFQSKK